MKKNESENKREREEITLVSTWIFVLKDKCLIQFYSRILGFNKLQFKVNLRTHYSLIFMSIYYLFSISIRLLPAAIRLTAAAALTEKNLSAPGG